MITGRLGRITFVVVIVFALSFLFIAVKDESRSLSLSYLGREKLCGTWFSANGSHNTLGSSNLQESGPRANDLTRDWKQHETRFMRGTPGFMMFENLYLYKGVLFAISSSPSNIPKAGQILSDPPTLDKNGRPSHPPATSQRWEVLTPAEANERLGEQSAGILPGITFLFNDGPGKDGFLAHYFHFVAEVFSGAWRVLTSSPSNLERNTAAETVFPARIMMPRGNDWRDSRANLITWFLGAVLPSTAIEDIYQWEDRAKSDTVYVFPEIIIVDRWAAHRVPQSEAQIWNKMPLDVFSTPAPIDWYGPLRQSLIQRLKIQERNNSRPVITYISRQATGRRLTDASHDNLVEALERFGEERDVEINVLQMESLSKTEQFAISTRTDILLGVHGNGLTHQMWMKPGGYVLEFFDVGGFLRDYQMLSEAMHHAHYVVWNDTIHETWREERKLNTQTKNFNNIPLHAPFVVGLLEMVMSNLKH